MPFEVFAEAYLATQKLVGAEEVWPADQVPIAVLRACCCPSRCRDLREQHVE